MQLGLYLRGLSPVSGVQSLRIMEGYELFPPHAPVTAVPVHCEGYVEEFNEAFRRAVMALSHAPDDEGEPFEVRLPCREQRVALEEGDDMTEQLVAVANHEHQRAVTFAVPFDIAALEPLSNQFENLSPVAVLADVELWDELKSEAACAISLYRNGEASLSVYIPCNVAVQPFLLIVRT
jgi:hypothetical protein